MRGRGGERLQVHTGGRKTDRQGKGRKWGEKRRGAFYSVQNMLRARQGEVKAGGSSERGPGEDRRLWPTSLLYSPQCSLQS